MDINQKFFSLNKSLMELAHGDGFVDLSRLNNIKKLLSAGAKELGASRISIWKYNDARDAIQCELLYLLESNSFESGIELFKQDFPLYFDAIATNRIISADDACNDPRTFEFKTSYLEPLSIKSMLDAPIFSDGSLSGVICVEHTNEQRKWDMPEMSYVASIADVISFINKHEEWVESKEKVAFLDRTDSLTGLENRRYFSQRLISDLKRNDSILKTRALVLLGLDHFADVNDTKGTNVADDILLRLSERFQKMSHIENCFLSRIGGDTFGFWLPALKEKDQLANLLNSISIHVNRSIKTLSGEFINVSGSMGVFTYPQKGSESHEPIRCAEIALKKAKDKKRGSTAFFSNDWMTQIQSRIMQEEDLLNAFKKKQFRAYYQPIFKAESQKIIGLEALVRWQHPTKGLVSPFQFLPMVSELGQMAKLGSFMMEQACKDMRVLRESGSKLQWVSVNLSADQLYDTRLAEKIEHLLHKYDVPASMFELEIVEELISQDSDHVRSQLQALSALGVRLSIDDFGTGFSSLSRLKLLPVSKLKIDKSFIDGLPLCEDDQCIAQSIIGLAKGMNLDLVAEGVETKAQAKWLIDQNCTYLQGYLYSKPLSFEKLVANFFKEA